MLDMHSPEAYATQLAAYNRNVTRVWNILIPRCALNAEVKPWGVRYLHPTKGYKTVGKRRFAIRGVF